MAIQDSKNFTPAAIDFLFGAVVFRIWPVVPAEACH
jgi:hypothetical protein